MLRRPAVNHVIRRSGRRNYFQTAWLFTGSGRGDELAMMI
jgi:hypothetical protein